VDLNAAMAELVKDLRPSVDLALAGEAKRYQQAQRQRLRRQRFWVLAGSFLMIAVGIWLR
jgi:hypothetical protein